jgi:hypothetical protein
VEAILHSPPAEAREGLAVVDELLPAERLGLLHGLADEGPRDHDALVEARGVAQVVRLLELLHVLLRLHLEVLAHLLRREPAWWVEWRRVHELTRA